MINPIRKLTKLQLVFVFVIWFIYFFTICKYELILSTNPFQDMFCSHLLRQFYEKDDKMKATKVSISPYIVNFSIWRLNHDTDIELWYWYWIMILIFNCYMKLRDHVYLVNLWKDFIKPIILIKCGGQAYIFPFSSRKL